MTYTDRDRQRWVAEPAKSAKRSDFTRDRARVLHCSALRRLAGKTQVLVAGESDVPRTRLTHSLEVAQVAREIGEALGCAPDVVEVAGLAHDLGHPPFGHNGETALNELATAAGGFEGNAQTFRVLTRLEAKVLRPGGSAGLNLTRAALDATAKYPWPATDPGSKFGVYADDLPAFEWMRAGAPQRTLCLEAQVMDWADDVAYSVHDLDDAIQLGHFLPDMLVSREQRDRVIEQCRLWYAPDAGAAELDEALGRLRALPCWLTQFDGSMADLASVKRMTSDLIGRFSAAAESATRERFGTGPLDRYQADLVVPRGIRMEVAVMKAVAATYVMLRPGAEALYEQQRDVVRTVVHELRLRDGEELEPWLLPAWRAATTDAGRIRVILDQVASLTDSSLVLWYRRLVGEPRLVLG
jgi:dGTPase